MNFYDSIIEGAQELPVIERGQLYAAILEYLYYEREPGFSMRPAPRAIYVSMRPILDAQLAKKRAGSRGGMSRSTSQAEAKQKPKQKPSRTQAEAQAEAKQNASRSPSTTQADAQAEAQAKGKLTGTGTVKEEELPSGSSKKRPRFAPPTAEEVAEYAERERLSLDAAHFVDFYASKGWMVGTSPMRDWRAAARNWARRDTAGAPAKGKVSADDFAAYDI